jgi:hypothetical protein
LWLRAVAVGVSNAFPGDPLARTDNDTLRFNAGNDTRMDGGSPAEAGESQKKTTLSPLDK